jgi:hypothetical protein
MPLFEATPGEFTQQLLMVRWMQWEEAVDSPKFSWQPNVRPAAQAPVLQTQNLHFGVHNSEDSECVTISEQQTRCRKNAIVRAQYRGP